MRKLPEREMLSAFKHIEKVIKETDQNHIPNFSKIESNKAINAF